MSEERAEIAQALRHVLSDHPEVELAIDGPWYHRMADAFLKRVATTGL